jgi:hypothetical protein
MPMRFNSHSYINVRWHVSNYFENFVVAVDEIDRLLEHSVLR